MLKRALSSEEPKVKRLKKPAIKVKTRDYPDMCAVGQLNESGQYKIEATLKSIQLTPWVKRMLPGDKFKEGRLF